ncbi:MAG: hypothetical protein KDA21_11230, partial [Phycisphaerales bacterium]|nr:hypothetical protein [Phycisphaerales bacterium]
ERIHRSNLVFMGVMPLEFPKGQGAASLGLDGTEVFDISLPAELGPGADIKVSARKSDGTAVTFVARCRIDTPVEVEYYRNGGILQTVIRRMLNTEGAAV